MSPDRARFPADSIDAEEVAKTLEETRARPVPDPPVAAGCVVAVVATSVLLALPLASRFVPIPSALVWPLGVVLGATALGGALVSVFGHGFTRGHVIGDVEDAIEQLLEAFPVGDVVRMREAAVRMLDHSIVSTGPTSVGTFDRAEVARRLGDALDYVVAVEEVLLERGEIYPCFTLTEPLDLGEPLPETAQPTSGRAPSGRSTESRASGEITDIWFRTEMPLMDIAEGMGLADPSADGESHWEWVIGRVGGVEVDITRTHTRPAGDVDTRLFLPSAGSIPPELQAELVTRVRRVVSGPIWCGRWVYRRGNEFDLVIVREHPAI